MQTAEVVSQSTSAASPHAEIDLIMSQAVVDGVFPGAVLTVGQKGEVFYQKAFGTLSAEKEVNTQLSTVYDIADVTGPLLTTTLIMRLVEAGKIKLSDKVCRYLQGFSVHGKSEITIRHLLDQTSGLDPYQPFSEELLKAHSGARRGIITNRVSKEYVINAINRMAPKRKVGKKQEYSELNFMVLGFIVEILTGMSLERAAQKLVFAPLEMRESGYIDLSMIRRRGIIPVHDVIAPTEKCSWRNRIVHGEVHNDNAWALGGIAGHAGLFSNAGDLHKLSSELIQAYNGESSFLRASTVRSFFAENEDSGSKWALGLERPTEDNYLDQTAFGDDVIGRDGFTGCSVWLEPSRNLDIVLLSNRIHPSRSNKKIASLRPTLFNTVLRLVD